MARARRLSPAYDLVNTRLFYPDEESVALTMGGRKKKFTRRKWIDFAEYCRIPKKAQHRPGIEAFGIFANHNEFYVLGSFVLKRGFHPGVKYNRPQIYVLIQPEAEFEQKALFQYSGFDIGVSDGAKQYCVKLAQLLEQSFRKQFTRFEVAFSSQVEVNLFGGKACSLRCCVQCLKGFPYNLGARSVSRNDRNAVIFRHLTPFFVINLNCKKNPSRSELIPVGTSAP